MLFIYFDNKLLQEDEVKGKKNLYVFCSLDTSIYRGLDFSFVSIIV